MLDHLFESGLYILSGGRRFDIGSSALFLCQMLCNFYEFIILRDIHRHKFGVWGFILLQLFDKFFEFQFLLDSYGSHRIIRRELIYKDWFIFCAIAIIFCLDVSNTSTAWPSSRASIKQT